MVSQQSKKEGKDELAEDEEEDGQWGQEKVDFVVEEKPAICSCIDLCLFLFKSGG